MVLQGPTRTQEKLRAVTIRTKIPEISFALEVKWNGPFLFGPFEVFKNGITFVGVADCLV